MKAGLVVSLVLLADLQALILQPAVWVALTLIVMAAMAVLVIRIARALIHPRKGKTMTRIETFAEQHRLKVRRDECKDQIVEGRRGHLYFDGPDLCLMVLDGEPAIHSKWAELGGKLWMGDLSPHPKTGRRVQDVTVTGIPLKMAELAIRMCRIKPKRIMSEAQAAVAAVALEKARRSSPPPRQTQRHGLEPLADPGVMVRGGKVSRNEERPL